MDNSGIYISATRLKSLPEPQRAFVFGLIIDEPTNALALPSAVAVEQPKDTGKQENDDLHFAELSPGQARDFYAGCGEKTKKAVEAIAAGPRIFQIADLAKTLGVEPGELGHVWGGLTRRTKTITGDSEAYLIDWHEGTQKYDAEGNYVDHTGEVTELTHRSLRKALKL